MRTSHFIGKHFTLKRLGLCVQIHRTALHQQESTRVWRPTGFSIFSCSHAAALKFVSSAWYFSKFFSCMKNRKVPKHTNLWHRFCTVQLCCYQFSSARHIPQRCCSLRANKHLEWSMAMQSKARSSGSDYCRFYGCFQTTHSSERKWFFFSTRIQLQKYRGDWLVRKTRQWPRKASMKHSLIIMFTNHGNKWWLTINKCTAYLTSADFRSLVEEGFLQNWILFLLDIYMRCAFDESLNNR